MIDANANKINMDKTNIDKTNINKTNADKKAPQSGADEYTTLHCCF
ncbi:TPA: hypothetical protein VEO38_000956 [Providencia alcalifaciens]|nr:hypothetical protein [Providencia alcalifaciens]